MSSQDRWQRMWELFHEAADLDADRRAAWLDDACAGDTELRTEVEELLAEHEEPATSFDRSPSPDIDQTVPGDRVGPYEIVRRIGEGGMGIVYEARQHEPVVRDVALKLILPGMDSREVISRFQAERQALALLEHPAIARVYDAGTTEAGRPYFAMELIRGPSIVEYCDDHQLDVEQRIELFSQVCDGVQHAHQRGIIHRDLKPTNVLVATDDGTALPKIIDFGIARAIQGHGVAERTYLTQLGTVVGTPEYMSPEQAGLTGEDVDTRTDVYALGALLYELLVGSPLFDSRRLREAGYAEMCRIIREEEPDLPSRRVTELGTLSRQLRGDLDWIVLKALDKERSRRYSSPSELAADLARFRDHRPIVARPPSAVYRARRFVRRHRLAVGAGVVVVLAILAGIAVGGVGLVRALDAEREARREATTARTVSSFLTELFEESEPGEQEAGSTTAREVLDRGVVKIRDSLQDQPDVRAALLTTLGGVYGKLGLYEEAIPLLDESVETHATLYGAIHPRTLEARSRRGGARTGSGDHEAALADYHFVVDGFLEHGGDHARNAALARQDLALVLSSLARYDEAREELELSVAVLSETEDAESSDFGKTLYRLAVVCTEQGDLDAAEGYVARALQTFRKIHGPDHPWTQYTLNSAAILYWNLEEYARARPVLEQALASIRRTHGEEHPYTAAVMNNLGLLLIELGEYDEARPLTEGALELRRRVLPEGHAEIAVSLLNLARLDADEGRTDAAIENFEEGIAMREAALGEDHPSLAGPLRRLAELRERRDH